MSLNKATSELEVIANAPAHNDNAVAKIKINFFIIILN